VTSPRQLLPTYQVAELIDAAQYARDILSVVPAFGDSIGTRTNKAQFGIALNKLTLALDAISCHVQASPPQ